MKNDVTDHQEKGLCLQPIISNQTLTHYFFLSNLSNAEGSMFGFIQLRTISYSTLTMGMAATILHVVNRDLLGMYPEFHLTSAFLTATIGGLLILIWPILYGYHREFTIAGATRAEMGDLKTAVIFLIWLGIVGWGIQWSGLYADFQLGSVIRTLIFGGIMVIGTGIGAKLDAYSRSSTDVTLK